MNERRQRVGTDAALRHEHEGEQNRPKKGGEEESQIVLNEIIVKAKHARRISGNKLWIRAARLPGKKGLGIKKFHHSKGKLSARCRTPGTLTSVPLAPLRPRFTTSSSPHHHPQSPAWDILRSRSRDRQIPRRSRTSAPLVPSECWVHAAYDTAPPFKQSKHWDATCEKLLKRDPVNWRGFF